MTMLETEGLHMQAKELRNNHHFKVILESCL